MNLRVACCVGALVAVCGWARADIVTNGGFETGDFSGWAQWGDTSFSHTYGHHHTGTWGALFSPSNPGGISQTLALNAGDTVNVRFWLGAVDLTPNAFSATLDGETLMAVTDYIGAVGSLYEGFSFTFVVQHDNPELSFSFQQGVLAGSFFFDDVSVSVVPAPASSLLAAGGLGGVWGLVLVRRRRVMPD